MTNPTTLVEQFSDTLGSFSGVDPIRFDEGLWLEEAGTNLIANPTAVTDTTGWAGGANRTTDRITSLPAPLPGWLASLVTTCYRVTATTLFGSGADILSSANQTLTAAPYAWAPYVYIPSGWTGGQIAVQVPDFAGASGTVTANLNMSLRDQWQRVEINWTPAGGDLVGRYVVRCTAAPGFKNGEFVYVAAMLAEQSAYLTSFIDLSLGDGYSNSPSPHSRAASSAALSPAGILSPASGALAFRFRRLIDTGGVEPIIECGTDGDDWFKAYIDADKLVAWWSSGGALPQYVTSVESIAVDTEYFIYIEWEGNTQALSINNGAKVVGSRDSVTGSWGAGDLVLKAE